MRLVCLRDAAAIVLHLQDYLALPVPGCLLAALPPFGGGGKAGGEADGAAWAGVADGVAAEVVQHPYHQTFVQGNRQIRRQGDGSGYGSSQNPAILLQPGGVVREEWSQWHQLQILLQVP